ncbi:MAG: class I SAM-dependent methyltransferase [Acidimicrobiales bacterium]
MKGGDQDVPVDAPPRLLDDPALEASSVVANSAMNRLRGLDGPNSYTRELGFNPLDRLAAAAAGAGGVRDVAWLDLCCGSGRALIEAAERLQDGPLAGRASLVGVDLVDFFAAGAAAASALELICAPVTSWEPERAFDLVTCVHGLHYVGDKLGLLARAAGWLTDKGVLVADFEPASARLADGRPAGRPLLAALRRAGFEVDTRRRRVTTTGPGGRSQEQLAGATSRRDGAPVTGPGGRSMSESQGATSRRDGAPVTGRRHVELPYRYLGADDRAGPNYTGQPGVHSYYDAG